jgi:hypothetical protein
MAMSYAWLRQLLNHVDAQDDHPRVLHGDSTDPFTQ